MANLNSFLSPYEILLSVQENNYSGIFCEIFFFFYHEIVCCVYSSESHHRGDSNVYTQHTFYVVVFYMEDQKSFPNYPHVLPDLVI